jgi:enolase
VATIDSIDHLRIYNSHLEPTTEFIVRLSGGACGRGASPHGETIGIYEQHSRIGDTPAAMATIRRDGVLGRELDQDSFDAYLAEKVDSFGRNICYALSLAFYAATAGTEPAGCGTLGARMAHRPRLCCNILNGGWHAYTNAVLSDFHEYLLVARTDDIEAVLGAHADVQRVVHEALLALPKTVVSGNPVSRFATADNRECIEFLVGVRDRLGLSNEFDLMIDAAGSNLQTPEGYRFSITDDSIRSGDELCEYWLDVAREYPLRFLEDPFGEKDTCSWNRLTTSQTTCQVIGDDFYCSDAARIEAGATSGYTHGAIIKPNQAGSVTATRLAIEAAARSGQIAIASHRSVSTETPFEAILTCTYGAPYIKIGPLLTDYSSIVRLNEIIRMTANGPAS